MIPHRLFALLARAIPALGAQRRLDLAQGVGLGMGGDKDGGILRREIATAFPEEPRV